MHPHSEFSRGMSQLITALVPVSISFVNVCLDLSTHNPTKYIHLTSDVIGGSPTGSGHHPISGQISLTKAEVQPGRGVTCYSNGDRRNFKRYGTDRPYGNDEEILGRNDRLDSEDDSGGDEKSDEDDDDDRGQNDIIV